MKYAAYLQKALLIAGLFAFLLSIFSFVAAAKPIPVTLQKTAQGWQLLRAGKPYFIRGAGGTGSLAALQAAGANSLRTWGDVTLELLDEAHAHGLSVAVGLWLGHERHGFDYSDKKQVQEQLARVRQQVLKLKDHPAVLLWGVGNEMEGFAAGDNPAIWQAVNDVAAMIKTIDPHHPTMTVTAFVHGQRIEFVHRQMPAIDIHGINAYGAGAAKVPDLLRQNNVTKPFILTEFGPMGAWDSPTTAWGAPYEQTSTAKAESYRQIYARAVLTAGEMNLGAYAFTWGHKMEATETWFGMFLADGARTGAVDAMTEIWSGMPPDNLAPRVTPLKITTAAAVEPGASVVASTVATDPEGRVLQARWVLKPESGEYVTGGDFRPTPQALEGAVVESTLNTATLRMPSAPGAYRLFYFVYDEAGNAATANIPLLVTGQVRTRMPFAVYEEQLAHMLWVPSGWMGNIDQLSLDGSNTTQPYAGKAALKIRYTGKFGWAGIAWQHPPNNWGELAGGFDLTGANQLELWARGEYGGEKVGFGVGLIGSDKSQPDSAMTKVDDIVLTHTWQRYTVPLAGLDLSSIKTGFVVTLRGRRTPVTIYLDNIRFKP